MIERERERRVRERESYMHSSPDATAAYVACYKLILELAELSCAELGSSTCIDENRVRGCFFPSYYNM